MGVAAAKTPYLSGLSKVWAELLISRFVVWHDWPEASQLGKDPYLLKYGED